MTLMINKFSLIILIFIGNIIIEISGSDDAKKGFKAEKFESRRSSPHVGAENGRIDPALIPKECINLGICETIPAGLEFIDISNIDQSEKDKYLVDEHPINEHRLGEDNDTLPLCESVSTPTKPFYGNADDGYWYQILNSENENIQTYTKVVCKQESGDCLTIDNVLCYDLDIPPICKQNFMTRKMAYVVKNKSIKYDKYFRIPISCTCKK